MGSHSETDEEKDYAENKDNVENEENSEKIFLRRIYKKQENQPRTRKRKIDKANWITEKAK